MSSDARAPWPWLFSSAERKAKLNQMIRGLWCVEMSSHLSLAVIYIAFRSPLGQRQMRVPRVIVIIRILKVLCIRSEIALEYNSIWPPERLRLNAGEMRSRCSHWGRRSRAGRQSGCEDSAYFIPGDRRIPESSNRTHLI